jgi:hypothetical protein
MKRIILSFVAFFAMVTISFAAWTVTPLETGRFYTDAFGQHYVLRLKCVSDGSTGSYVMNLTNLTQNIYLNIMGKFMYSMAADPGAGTTAAVTPSITNQLGAVIWADSANFANDSIVQVPGGSYNGYPPHFTDDWTITFNDIGDAGEVYVLDLDFLR